jgi:hypothetical protein
MTRYCHNLVRAKAYTACVANILTKSADEVDQVLAGHHRGSKRRSPMKGWLKKHRIRLEAEFAEKGVDWAVIAEGLIRLGIVDRDGNNPTPAKLASAWYQIRREAKASARKETRPIKAAPIAKEPSLVTVLEPADEPAAENPVIARLRRKMEEHDQDR